MKKRQNLFNKCINLGHILQRIHTLVYEKQWVEHFWNWNVFFLAGTLRVWRLRVNPCATGTNSWTRPKRTRVLTRPAFRHTGWPRTENMELHSTPSGHWGTSWSRTLLTWSKYRITIINGNNLFLVLSHTIYCTVYILIWGSIIYNKCALLPFIFCVLKTTVGMIYALDKIECIDRLFVVCVL